VQINQRAKEMVDEIVKICDENSELVSYAYGRDKDEFYQ